jgi:hypothetical protein
MAATNNIAEFLGPAPATALVLGLTPAAAFGFAEVRSRAWIWATLAAFCVALFFVLAPWFVLGPIVAREQYGDIAVFGILSAVFGAGMVVGAIAGIRWRPRYPMRLAMTFVLALPAGIGLYASGLPLELVGPAIWLSGVGVALFDVSWVTALAERVPPDKLSRVTSYDWMVSLGLVPIGYVLAGPAAAELGAPQVLLGGSVIAFGALALGLLPRETRMLERTLPADAPLPLGEIRAQLPDRVAARPGYAVAACFLPARSSRRCSRTRCRTPLRPSVSSPE